MNKPSFPHNATRRKLVSVLMSGIMVFGMVSGIVRADVQQELETGTSLILDYSTKQASSQVHDQLESQFDARIIHRYDHVFSGSAIQIPVEQMQDLLQTNSIVRYEYSRRTRPAGPGTQVNNKQWNERKFVDNRHLHRVGASSRDIAEGIAHARSGSFDENLDWSSHLPIDEVNIAVLDTQVNAQHPYIPGKVTVKNKLRLGAEGDFQPALDCADSYCSDHGTHVAGLIAGRASGNHFQDLQLGVAPGVNLISVAVLPRNRKAGYRADILAGLDYVLRHHRNQEEIHAVNLSLGGKDDWLEHPFSMSSLHKSFRKLQKHDIPIVVAAGNDRRDIDGWFSNAAYAISSDSITVSAITDTDGKANGKGDDFKIYSDGKVIGKEPDDSLTSFSNYGDEVDVAAPGRAVWSTISRWANSESSLQVMPKSGTSMAAPIVTGQLALIQSVAEHRNKDYSSNEITRILNQYSAGPLPIGSKWPGDPDSDPEPSINVKITLMNIVGEPYFEQNPWEAEPILISEREREQAFARARKQGRPVFVKRRKKSDMKVQASQQVSSGLFVRMRPDGTLEMKEIGNPSGARVTSSQ